MTTIATDGVCVAFDGRLTSHGTILSDSETKAWEISPGIICAAAGDSDDAVEFAKWLTDSLGAATPEKPKMGDSFEGILVDTIKGTCRYYCRKLLPSLVTLPFAVGSGSHFAIGAMLAGAHPIDAVHAAMERDMGTGGAVHCLPVSKSYEFPESKHSELCVALGDLYDGLNWFGALIPDDDDDGAPLLRYSVLLSPTIYSHTKELFARVGALLKSEGQHGRTDQTEPADQPG